MHVDLVRRAVGAVASDKGSLIAGKHLRPWRADAARCELTAEATVNLA